MKQIILFCITIYQKFLSDFIKNLFGTSGSCRFSPSCSNYASEAVLKFGVIRGGSMAIARVIRCNPFGPFGLDQVRS